MAEERLQSEVEALPPANEPLPCRCRDGFSPVVASGAAGLVDGTLFGLFLAREDFPLPRSMSRVKVSHDTVWQFLRREGLRFKKTLLALEQARADVAQRRQRWRSWQSVLDPRRLVFIDETWIKTNMAPLRGWGPKGKRLRSFAPHGHWRTLTFLGALRCDRLTAPCVFDGLDQR